MRHDARPVIGLNVDFVNATKNHRAHLRLPVGYHESILAAGGLPVILPPMSKEGDLRAFLDRVDGFVLVGGLDLDPVRNGQPRHHTTTPMAEKRDQSDRMLVRLLLEKQMPLLAIGVGLQQINVACEGNLYVHLPEEMPRGLPHWDPTCNGPHRHLVFLQPGTRLEEIYGEGEIRVNSNHHQAVKQVGSLFRPAAVAPDGVIEAVEAIDPGWFCVGVQWHPESETSSALDQQLFECFVQASASQCRQPALAA